MRVRAWFLLSLLATGAAWLYAIRIQGPWEHYVDVEHGPLKAQMGDLYPRWLAARELLLHGRNPYGPEVSHEIQMAFYGHALDQNFTAGEKILDEQRFAYPVYVVFLMAPTVHMDFQQVQAWAPVAFALLTAASVLLWLDFLQWWPPRGAIAAIILFVITSPQVVQGLRLRQLGMLAGFLIALSACCVVRNQLAIAGVALAFSTIKPQMVLFVVAWFLLWAMSGWRRRWPLLAGFGVTLAALVGLGQLILPGWIGFFADGLFAYRQYYFGGTSLLFAALGKPTGAAISGILIVMLSVVAWRNQRAEAGSPEFARVLVAAFVGTTLVLPLLPPFNQVLLLLPALMVVRDWRTLPRSLRGALALVFAWPWITRFLLLLLRVRPDSPSSVPLLPSVIVLFVPFIFLALLIVTRSSRATRPQPPCTKLPAQ